MGEAIGEGAGQAADPRFAEVRTLVFGIGAQKAGTTWLHRYLRSHPQVSMPALKETTYWNFVETGAAHGWTRRRAERLGAGRGPLPTLLRRLGSPFPSLRPEEMRLQARMLDAPEEGHRRYADLLFHGYRGEPVLGEITPTYALLGERSFAAMAGLSRDARFVLVMRDPVARAVSGLAMALERGWAGPGLASLDAAIGAALADPGASFAIRSSRYDLTLARLESVVPRDRILALFYETLFRQESIDRLTAFLGVAPHPAPTERRVLGGRRRAERPTPARLAGLRAALAPVYDFAAARYGAEVPEGWRM